MLLPASDYAFHLGLINDLIGTRPTNRVDLEYLYYLPFCQAFTTGDKFLAKLAQVILASRQNFIPAAELKADLHGIADWWGNLTGEEKKARWNTHGHYPPENPNSVTHQVWLKYMKPWKPQEIILSPEQKVMIDATILEHARAAKRALDAQKERK